VTESQGLRSKLAPLKWPAILQALAMAMLLFALWGATNCSDPPVLDGFVVTGLFFGWLALTALASIAYLVRAIRANDDDATELGIILAILGPLVVGTVFAAAPFLAFSCSPT
jgi:hypothetical protein